MGQALANGEHLEAAQASQGITVVLFWFCKNTYQGADELLLDEYESFLSGKAEGGTIDAYLRTVRHLMAWMANRPRKWRRSRA